MVGLAALGVVFFGKSIGNSLGTYCFMFSELVSEFWAGEKLFLAQPCGHLGGFWLAVG